MGVERSYTVYARNGLNTEILKNFGRGDFRPVEVVGRAFFQKVEILIQLHFDFFGSEIPK